MRAQVHVRDGPAAELEQFVAEAVLAVQRIPAHEAVRFDSTSSR